LGYIDGLNRYSYVHNNPINFNDPNGLLARSISNAVTPTISYFGSGQISQTLGETVAGFGGVVQAGQIGQIGRELTSFPPIPANYSSTRSYESARADTNSVLGIVGVGSVSNVVRVAAATDEVSALLKSYGGPGGGHHVPAKSAFTGAANYDANVALAIPNSQLASLGVSHSAVTGAQMTGYQAFAKTGEALTWEVMATIEANALVRGGMAESMANITVNQAIQALKDTGVSGPTRIPWGR
jgi:uncharacterized protein RhaS with RHS repeats